MKLLKKIKNWFKPLPPKESKVKKADYQLYADDSEEAKKFRLIRQQFRKILRTICS